VRQGCRAQGMWRTYIPWRRMCTFESAIDCLRIVRCIIPSPTQSLTSPLSTTARAMGAAGGARQSHLPQDDIRSAVRSKTLLLAEPTTRLKTATGASNARAAAVGAEEEAQAANGRRHGRVSASSSALDSAAGMLGGEVRWRQHRMWRGATSEGERPQTAGYFDRPQACAPNLRPLAAADREPGRKWIPPPSVAGPAYRLALPASAAVAREKRANGKPQVGFSRSSSAPGALSPSSGERHSENAGRRGTRVRKRLCG
jgi:hypothetical protein